ncbi:MAG: B12-binding domain-containing radical SAM protein [Dehalococcoidia bacterium]
MKILLINPVIRPKSPPAYFPLGLGYMASLALRGGHDVEVLDINAHRWTPAEVEAKIQRASFDLAGITGMITEYRQVRWLASVLRKYHRHEKLVLGGGLASSAPEFLLQVTDLDVLVLGEGEEVFPELVARMEKGEPYDGIGGIAFRRQGNVVLTPERRIVQNLDDIPFPAWDLFPMEVYLKGEKLGFEFPARSMNIISSRGCPFRCSYCFHGLFGYKFRYRSPENTIAEMRYLRDTYDVHGIVFSDDLFVTNRKRTVNLCDKLIESGLGLRWMSNARVDLVDEDLLRKMKAAGCHSIFFGLESGSQRMLDSMKKGTKVEQAEKALKACRAVGLPANGYFIIGLPGETRETVRETVEFCKRLGLEVDFNVATPLPDTPLYAQSVELGKIGEVPAVLEKWDAWNENMLVNLTTMSDDELMKLKEEAEEEINSFVRRGHLGRRLKGLQQFWASYGFLLLLKKLGYRTLRLAGVMEDPYIQAVHKVRRSGSLWASVGA